MHAIRELGRIALGPFGIRTLDTDMLMCVIAFARNVREPLSIAVDGPRLLEGYPLGPWRVANQTVHAAIEMMSCTAPPLEAGLDVTVAPICAGPRPLNGDTPTVCDAGVCHLAEPQPEAAEYAPLLTDLPPCSGPPVPVHTLIRGSPCTRQAAEQEGWDARRGNRVHGLLQPPGCGEVVIGGKPDDLALRRSSAANERIATAAEFDDSSCNARRSLVACGWGV